MSFLLAKVYTPLSLREGPGVRLLREGPGVRLLWVRLLWVRL
jgi:hypothetical protein